MERFAPSAQGLLRHRPKTPFRDGTTNIVFELLGVAPATVAAVLVRVYPGVGGCGFRSWREQPILRESVTPVVNQYRAGSDSTLNDVQMRWGVKIPLRDGVHLNATLYLPATLPHPTPAIFIATPYGGQSSHEDALYFAAHGYPFLAVDVRGRGNSEGTFHPSGESRDGNDVVEWIARQPYCNGQVAMCGGSYAGYVQWSTIKENSPHLATIVPVASPYRGVDSPLRNNLFEPYTMQWLTLISGRTVQDKIFADHVFWRAQFRRWFEAGAAFRTLDTFLGNPSALFQEWISHPQQDSYWDRYNPTPEEYARLGIPILTITGIYDSNQPGALAHYRRYMSSASATGHARHYLVIGPWDHAGTRLPQAKFGGLEVGAASLIDLRQLHLDWYAWTMRGGQKPQFLQKNVAYYVMGTDRWRYADTLEAVTVSSRLLYLSSDGNPTDLFHSGSLTSARGLGGGPDWYVYDPRDLSGALTESDIDPDSQVDQRLMASVGRRLVYQSAPFDEDTEVSGFFKLCAWIAIDCPDTDLRVWIYEIGLDGGSVLLTMDSMRARYRESYREARLVNTQEPLRYDFERFMFVSRQIRKGHRLRLVLGPIDSIFSQKNHNSGGVICEETLNDARAVTVRLFHENAHPSALHVPMGNQEPDRDQ